MTDDQLSEIWAVQKSLTEWLEDINHKDAALIQREDNDKRNRLKVLSDIISLPFDEPVQFEAAELAYPSAAFKKYLKEHGDELCALRLIPKEHGLPKIRMRGKNIRGAYAWFKEQGVDSAKYLADFVPHEKETIWSTIFVVNHKGIYGEILHGGHHQLTQGLHQTDRPRVFSFNFKDWSLWPADKAAEKHLKLITDYIKVDNLNKQEEIKSKLDTDFIKHYIKGYFETTYSVEFGVFFKDYSPSLGKLYEDMSVSPPSNSDGVVHGQSASVGKAKGPVYIVNPSKIDADFPPGGVLVCPVTTPDYVPLMQKAAAIVTDQGGILSHAAIVARELKIPCIVGTKNATSALKNGQTVSVDADSGTVRLV